MPVGEMLRQMDSREISEWMAYMAIKSEPAPAKPEEAKAKMRALFGNRVIKKKG